jgi:hypothetical protein
MRFEQFIAAVTRPVVIATVRAIQAARVFANASSLQLWHERVPLGMPAYWDAMPCSSLRDGLVALHPGAVGSQRGRLHCQPRLALASCPVETSRS